MKKLTKYSKLLVIIMIIASMAAGCGQKGSVGSGNTTDTTGTMYDSAYDKGLEIVGLMDEMIHSDKYISMMSGGGEIEKKAGEIAEGRYDSPSQVFCLGGFSWDDMISMIGGEKAVSGFSGELKNLVNQKMVGGIISQINAQEGSVALATASVLSAGSSFVCQYIKEDCIYLYVYRESYPVAVVFTVGDYGAVNATGYYLLSEEIKSSDEKDVQQEIDDIFGMYGCSVEKVK